MWKSVTIGREYATEYPTEAARAVYRVCAASTLCARVEVVGDGGRRGKTWQLEDDEGCFKRREKVDGGAHILTPSLASASAGRAMGRRFRRSVIRDLVCRHVFEVGVCVEGKEITGMMIGAKTRKFDSKENMGEDASEVPEHQHLFQGRSTHRELISSPPIVRSYARALASLSSGVRIFALDSPVRAIEGKQRVVEPDGATQYSNLRERRNPRQVNPLAQNARYHRCHVRAFASSQRADSTS
ncbi:hypothetical protein BC567DRAFT_275589 [Phyllosticta citribraziliensis]